MKKHARSGDWNCICDYSGFKVLARDCRLTWDGYFVHKRYWEPRQPQDFVRGVKDNQTVPIARPESEDTFLTANEVTRDDL